MIWRTSVIAADGFVRDSSVALARLLPDKHNDAADTLADRPENEAVVVPAMCRLVVGNALLMARGGASNSPTS